MLTDKIKRDSIQWNNFRLQYASAQFSSRIDFLTKARYLPFPVSATLLLRYEGLLLNQDEGYSKGRYFFRGDPIPCRLLVDPRAQLSAIIENYLEKLPSKKGISVNQIWSECFNETEEIDKGSEKLIRHIVRSLKGWEEYVTRLNGYQLRCYRAAIIKEPRVIKDHPGLEGRPAVIKKECPQPITNRPRRKIESDIVSVAETASSIQGVAISPAIAYSVLISFELHRIIDGGGSCSDRNLQILNSLRKL